MHNISVYKEKIGVNLREKIFIYTSQMEDGQQKYKMHKKINKKIECSQFLIFSNHIVFANRCKAQLLKLNGDVEREWVFDAKIKYMRSVGGPANRESFLVGL